MGVVISLSPHGRTAPGICCANANAAFFLRARSPLDLSEGSPAPCP